VTTKVGAFGALALCGSTTPTLKLLVEASVGLSSTKVLYVRDGLDPNDISKSPTKFHDAD
jgi:hypothetical protein